MTNRVGRPKSDIKNVNVNVRLPEAAVERLKYLAERREVSVNGMARILILRCLNENYNLGSAMRVDTVVENILNERSKQ